MDRAALIRTGFFTPRLVRLANALFLASALPFLLYAFYPGRFNGDTVSERLEALTGRLEDQHSAQFSAFIGLLAQFGDGPAPMFTLQLFLWICGVLLLSDTLIASGNRIAGLSLSLASMLPIVSFDYLEVQSDAMLSALAVLLTGLGARALFLGTHRVALGIAAFCLLPFALDVRANAVILLFPLWFLAWQVRNLHWRPFLVAVIAGVAVFAAVMSADESFDHKVLGARRTYRLRFIIVFDLAGISARTGSDQSGGLLPGFAEKAKRCYTPKWWDPFIAGACKDVGMAAQRMLADKKLRPQLVHQWLRAIARHPVIYARHRLASFGCLMRIGCYELAPMTEGVSYIRYWDRDAPLRVSAPARVMENWAMAWYYSPFGSGAFWLLVLGAEAMAAGLALRLRGFAPTRYLALILALAGLFYGLAFTVIGVAYVMRYLHPMIYFGVIGVPICLSAICDAGGVRLGRATGSRSPAPA